MLCRQQVAELAGKKEEFSRKEVELAVIGCGKASHIERFKKVTGYGGKVFTDPAREVFRSLGLITTISGLFGRKTLTRSLGGLLRGVWPGMPRGSVLQLGGAVIVASDGTVLYQYRCIEAGDEPPIGEMLAALS